jgi:hypothetical protein
VGDGFLKTKKTENNRQKPKHKTRLTGDSAEYQRRECMTTLWANFNQCASPAQLIWKMGRDGVA